MKRKVSLIGPSTLMVSLPSKWVKEKNIKKGDEVEIIEDGSELRLLTAPRKEYMKIRITLQSSNDWYVSQYIRNLYIAGYDEVHVSFKDPNILTEVQDIVNMLPGFEIIDLADDHCIIKNISTGVETELDTLLRRIFLLTKSLFEIVEDELKKGELNLKKISDIRINIHKFANLYRRTITKNKMYSLVQNRSIFIIITRMMQISHNVLYLYKYLDSKKHLPDLKESAAYMGKLRNLFNLFYDIFYTKKFERLPELHQMRHKLINVEFVQAAEKGKGENIVVLHYLAEIVRLISTNGGAMLNFHLDQ